MFTDHELSLEVSLAVHIFPVFVEAIRIALLLRTSASADTILRETERQREIQIEFLLWTSASADASLSERTTDQETVYGTTDQELDKICVPRKWNRRNWPGRGLKRRTTSFFYKLDIMRKNTSAVKESWRKCKRKSRTRRWWSAMMRIRSRLGWWLIRAEAAGARGYGSDARLCSCWDPCATATWRDA